MFCRKACSFYPRMLFQDWSSRFLGMLNYAKKHLQGQSWLLSSFLAMEFGVVALVSGACASVNVAWNVFVVVALVFLVLREWQLRCRVEELCRSASNGFCSHCVCRYTCEREVECYNGSRCGSLRKCRIRGCIKEANGENQGEEEEDVVTEMRKEREYKDALALELEKERMAASSAADEAMTMILRLQSEKALVEREAHQYRAMAEQKQLYDQEIIESLRWIIVKLEEERRDGWKSLEKISTAAKVVENEKDMKEHETYEQLIG